jgi:formate-dependent phosphoribosylglycinamide formyltransferase (GAR transformylase)
MAVTKQSFARSVDEEVINHYGAVRTHVTGFGSLKLKLFSIDEVKQSTLLPLTILAKNNIEPNRLANFTQQKAKLEIRTTEIDEVFSINKVIVFAKPVAKSYPE